MNIVITNQALQWFSDEMEVQAGDTIRFYVRYGGSNPFHEGFSLGMSKDEPMNPTVIAKHEGVTFFIEEDDVWFFNNHDLYVDFDQELDELSYDYK
ncbi:HesB/YadR/YfhF family protein [Rummeliibacillus pycnus]|uniref:HesB/YadR/YfhF family protein n=1 Tax=Rummeliibacillus pycnus TaxID=101070 RepID=UPI0037CA109A